MSYGSIYPVSYWGNVNEANGWGIVYPFNSDGERRSISFNKLIDDEIFNTSQLKSA